MTAYRKTGVVVDTTAALTDKGVNVFAFFSRPLFPWLTEAQDITPSLFRCVTVDQRLSFLHFLN